MTTRPDVPPHPAQDAHADEVRDRRSVADFLRLEISGGLLLLLAATVALVWINSPLGDAYVSLRDHHLDIPALGLELSVEHWASEGLLAVFFFIAGIELKRELVVGELRRPAAAALPVVAAVGGMVTPALVYVAVVGVGGGTMDGWAVPMATDIAFALGVLAVAGRHMPSALRTFLLTLAIVDDLLAIIVIALFFTSSLNFWALAGALAGLGLFSLLHRRGVRGWYLYVPLSVAIWVLMYNSGVHATVAGVAIGMLLRAVPGPYEKQSPAERVEHLVHPYSAGIAVPLFALFATGVEVSGGTLADMAGEPEALGVAFGLFAGKLVGVLGAAYLTARFTRARLTPTLAWADLTAGAMLAGIGFTVSLLITELAFAEQPTMEEHVKVAVLIGSLAAALCACALLAVRSHHYRRSRERGTDPDAADASRSEPHAADAADAG